VWQRNPKANASTTSKQRLDELMIFLQAVLSEDKIAIAMDRFGINEERGTELNKHKKKSKTESKEIVTARLLSAKEEKNSCIFCDQSHDSALCGKIKKISRRKISSCRREECLL